ncbi:MAG: transcription termination factor NusA [Tissierellia bacterium]|nr:transcription termination factor NusA [Tissierellia bacterium]
MNKDFILALEEIEREKGIPRDAIFEALEKALIKSYEKNFDNNANVLVEIDRLTGDIKVYATLEVVEEVEDPVIQIGVEEANRLSANYVLGDTVKQEVTPKDFGRIAAQTARNIVIQKIKDMERDVIYGEFIDRERELVNGTIQRIDNDYLFIDLGKVEGIVPPAEQVPGEKYSINNRMKFYISEVKNTPKGAQITLSRTAPGLIIRLFELEVPEVNDGVVEIFSTSREAGSRTKIAVFAKEPDVDPVGACVGFKGARVKAIVDELDGEKIDIIVWDKDIRTFIANSLSPSKVLEVLVKDKEKSALAVVPDDQLSLAIGKEGQNVRLAARLTGWKIDIKGKSKYREMLEEGLLEEYSKGDPKGADDEQAVGLGYDLDEILEEYAEPFDHEEDWNESEETDGSEG